MRVHYRFRIVEAIRSVADHGRDPDRVGDIAVPDRTQIVEPFKMTAAGPVLQPPATNDSPTDPSNWFGAIHRGVDVEAPVRELCLGPAPLGDVAGVDDDGTLDCRLVGDVGRCRLDIVPGLVGVSEAELERPRP
jgi:hypothetical protein